LRGSQHRATVVRRSARRIHPNGRLRWSGPSRAAGARRDGSDPFGELLTAPTTTDLLERFTGQWNKKLDPVAGLVQMGACPCDANLGRFYATCRSRGTVGGLSAADSASRLYRTMPGAMPTGQKLAMTASLLAKNGAIGASRVFRLAAVIWQATRRYGS
jgi:hypothetical protein